jgi:hypothetical protein
MEDLDDLAPGDEQALLDRIDDEIVNEDLLERSGTRVRRCTYAPRLRSPLRPLLP